MTAPTPLEARYRRALLLLPGRYRAAWADDMVTSLLDSRGVDGSGTEQDVIAGLGHPGPAEIASVVSLSVRVRLGVFGATPRQAFWGEAVRRFALVGLLVAAASVVVRIVWDAVQLHRLDTSFVTFSTARWLSEGPWPVLLALAALLWLPAYLFLVVGRRRAAVVLAVLAIVPTVTRTVLDLTEFSGFVTGGLVYLLVVLLPVVALAAFHEGAPGPARRPWLLALPVTAGPLLLLLAAYRHRNQDGPLSEPEWYLLLLTDRPGVYAVAASAAGVVHLASRRNGRPFGASHWTLALALVAAATALERAATLVDYLRLMPGQFGYAVVMTSGAVELVLVTAVAVVLATTARSDLPGKGDGPAPLRGTGPSVTA